MGLFVNVSLVNVRWWMSGGEGLSRMDVRIAVLQDYKSIRTSFIICLFCLINTERQTCFDRLYTISSAPGELKS